MTQYQNIFKGVVPIDTFGFSDNGIVNANNHINGPILFSDPYREFASSNFINEVPASRVTWMKSVHPAVVIKKQLHDEKKRQKIQMSDIY